MTPFTYHRPSELSDAVALLGESAHQARIIAGGQSLLLWMKDRIARPERLMSIASLPGMKGLRHRDDGVLEIGAATTYATLAQSKLSGWHAEIASVAGNLADRSVRSLGTVGGALCDANPRYDMPTLVVATDATLIVASSAGNREIKAEDFFSLGGGTVLEPCDLLVSIAVPSIDRFDTVAFEKFRHRVFEAAVVSVCCGVKLDAAGGIADLRLAVGAITKAPRLAAHAVDALVGARPKDVDVQDVARRVSAELMPAAGLTTRPQAYQAELVISLTARALTRAFSAKGDVMRCPR